MLHARIDYQEIQDPRKNPIPEDEPVMLFRAQDRFAPDVLQAYADLLRKQGNDPEMVRRVEVHAQRMRDWQANHLRKFPDVPVGCYYEEPLEVDQDVESHPIETKMPQRVSRPPENTPDKPVDPEGPQKGEFSSENVNYEQIGLPTHEQTEDGPKTVVQEGEDSVDTPQDELKATVHKASDPTILKDGDVGGSTAGPLSPGGEALMGGQPTEHGYSQDPVFKDEEKGKWFHYDETWSDILGPFDTEDAARKALAEYAEHLDTNEDEKGD